MTDTLDEPIHDGIVSACWVTTRYIVLGTFVTKDNNRLSSEENIIEGTNPSHKIARESHRGVIIYYSALGCTTLFEDNKLLALMSFPLLDRDCTIYQIAHTQTRAGQKLGMIVKYRIETKFIALDLARKMFMLLTREEVEKCKTDALTYL